MARYTIDGKRVSPAWHTVLSEARERGIDFRLNSGRRTMAEQWALWRAYRNGSGVLAAFPSPFAPHIRVGRAGHAIDVDQFAGDGEQALQNWLRKHGVDAVNNVPGEGWHIDPRRGLRRLARRIRKKRDAQRKRRRRRRR